MPTEKIFGVDSGPLTTRVSGFTQTSYEALSSNFEFITIVVPIDIRTSTGGGTAASQAALDKLIQIVSERGQPVIMGAVTGTGPCTLKLTIEHPYAWQSTATSTSAPTYASTGVTTAVDPRAGEDLVAKILADGINYNLTATSVTFGNFLA